MADDDLKCLVDLLDDKDHLENRTQNVDSESNSSQQTFQSLSNPHKVVFEQRLSDVHTGDTDSSDDEDNRNCFEGNLNEFGKRIKKMLSENVNKSHERTTVTRENNWKTKITKINQQVDKKTLKENVDAIFGLRVRNPLVSSVHLQDKMAGRKNVSFCSIKRHLLHEDLKEDWVIMGVIVHKSPIKTSQSGKNYCVWRISDLKPGLKTVSVFLFSNAFKNHWKLAVGSAIGILNPNVLNNKDDSKDEAALSVINPQTILILGQSKDYGTCKSRTKNGEMCTAFVNMNDCEYCVFHVQKEYKKCSKRAELQSPIPSNQHINLRNKVLGKNEVFYGGKSFVAISAKKNTKQIAKDQTLLKKLSDYGSKSPIIGYGKLEDRFPKQKVSEFNNFKKDAELLERLEPSKSGTSNFNRSTSRMDSPLFTKDNILHRQTSGDELKERCPPANNGKFVPRLGIGIGKGELINLNTSPRRLKEERAKLNAIKWFKQNGPIQKEDPNAVKKNAVTNQCSATTSVTPERKKIKLADSSETCTGKEKPFSKFQQLLEAKSRHTLLLEANDQLIQDEYFEKLEKKERIEEKMMKTYKVDCKAVHCLKCKYTSFSAADLCKTEGHTLKIVSAVKRFFKCADCGNRTVALTLIPLHTCKQCNGSRWEKAPMMKEKKIETTHVLSIRGEEEKYLGSLTSKSNMSLLLPND